VNEQTGEIVARLRELLGCALAGVYLHGSFALGCGNPNRSDLDLLVVTRRPLTPAERDAFAELPRGVYDRPGWPRPLELSVLRLDQLHPWRHPTPYDLHVAENRAVGPGEDPDLAAHVTVARRAGIALAGPPPHDVFPEVPRTDYVDSLLRDFDSVHADGRPWVPYATLSPARVWAQLAEPDVLHTKDSAAEWALARLPAQHRRALELALASYRGQGRDLGLPQAEWRAYVDAVADEVQKLRP
jgi:predicted nucleotidyltransferase